MKPGLLHALWSSAFYTNQEFQVYNQKPEPISITNFKPFLNKSLLENIKKVCDI